MATLLVGRALVGRALVGRALVGRTLVGRGGTGTLPGVRTLILDPSSAGLGELIERRRRSGLDRLDEMWDGVLHMVPAPSGEHADLTQQLAELLAPPARAAGLFPTLAEFNLGDSDENYRVPDGGLHRERLRGVWHSTAALVVEVVSPGDETWEKLSFYAEHHVDEMLIVNPPQHTVDWLVLDDGEYHPIDRSRLIALGSEELTRRIDWP